MDRIKAFFAAISTYLIVAGVIALLIFFLATQVPLVRYFFEDEAPVITMQRVPKGLGVTPQKVKLLVEDPLSGIELVRIRAEQSSLTLDLYSEYPPLGVHEHEVEVTLDAIASGFKRGMVKITIEAFDRSLASNGARHSFEIPVRFDAPAIEIVSGQHNTNRTGMEFVLYRIKSDSVLQTGVRVGNTLFKGFAADQFDPDLSGISDLYFSFFSIPREYQESEGKILVYATNEVGNAAEQSFYYRIRDRKFRSWEYTVPDIEQSRFTNQEILRKVISGLKFHPERFWSERLKKPFGSDSSPRIGDKILLTDASGEVKEFVNDLMSFRTRGRAQVLVPDKGALVFRDYLQGLGGVTIIDHGFGLLSVYSGLKNMPLQKEGHLHEGDILGDATFLDHLGSEGYEYGLFFQGTPVRAEEWWDSTWVFDHILLKIQELKVRFNIRSVVISEESSGNLPEQGFATLKSIERQSPTYDNSSIIHQNKSDDRSLNRNYQRYQEENRDF
jgi:hypothetical protein